MTAQATMLKIFDDRKHAERALKELKRAGFRDDQVGFALRATVPPVSDATGQPEAGGDAARDGSDALAAGHIPGIGPMLTAGVLTGILGGASAGAVAGGLLGALVSLGVPETEARRCVQQFHAGRPIVVVRTDGRAAEAAAILHRNGVSSAQRRPGATSTRTGFGAEAGQILSARVQGLQVKLRTE
jgi:hypothetical protein